MSVTQFGLTRWEAREITEIRGTGVWRGRGQGEKGTWRERDMELKDIWSGSEWDKKGIRNECEKSEKEGSKDRDMNGKEEWTDRENNTRETKRERKKDEGVRWKNRDSDEANKDSAKNTNKKEDDSDEDATDDELAPLTPAIGEERRSRAGRLDWCHCRKCVKMKIEDECRCCHEDEGVWGRILEDESTSSGTSAYSCVVADPFFTSVCLNPYALQALHSRDSHLFGYEESLPLHEKYRVTAYRAFVEYYQGQLEHEVECRHLPSCASSTIKAHFQDHAFLVKVPGYAPL